MNNLMNAIADPVLIIDSNYKIVFINKAALDLCGMSAEEVLGENCHEISHRCPVPCVLPEKCPHREVFSSGTPSSVRHKHRCREGKERIFSITASPICDDAGRVVLMIEILRDVTEEEATAEALKTSLKSLEKSNAALSKSEAFMRNILESIEEGFVIIDRDYRIVSANRAYCQQAKCDVKEITGKHCYEVSHHLAEPCFLAGEDCAPARTFQTGAPSSAIHTHYDSNGNPLHIETRSYPVKDEAGAVPAVIETLNNLTEMRKLEDQLRHAQKMEAIGSLAGGIAHDFNNLFSVITGYGELARMQMHGNESFTPKLEAMLDAAVKAAQLTRGLLAFSRKQVMDLKLVSAEGIVTDFRKMLDRIIGEDIELRVTTGAGASTIMADRSQIEQVLMNLATNARDAMPHGGGFAIETGSVVMDTDFIAAHGFGEPGGYVLISVSDTGTGMDEETKQRIFEPYFTTKEIGRGTGLGLSIAYGIVKQHRGFIECLSEKGKGTTFRIYLPVTESTGEADRLEDAAVLRGGSETILVAEDDISVRTLLIDMLEGYGYSVIPSVDGNDAVTKFKDHQHRIRLLLFDVIMPGKGGKDAYEEIRHIKPGVKVIFISGYARDLIEDRGVLGSAAEFLQKPVSPMDLLNKIRMILDR